MENRGEFTMEDVVQDPKIPMILRRACSSGALTWAIFVLGGCASFRGAGGPTLQEEIEAVIMAEPLHQVHWGILIVDPDRGQILYSHSSHRKFVPASNMKILSTATALSLLGPEYRFETELWGVGDVDGSTGSLAGDLVLRASGDPTFSERFYPSAEAPLDSLAQGLWRAGLRSVTGSLVVDVSAWDSTTVPESWMVGNLPSTSAATGGALAIGEGEIVVEVTPGAEIGDPVQARWWPATEESFFSAAFVTAHPDSSLRREVDYLPESRRLRVEGQVPLGPVDTISVAQRDPVRFASSALLRALERQGIFIGGGLRIAWERGEPLGPGFCVTGRAYHPEGTGAEVENALEEVPGPVLPDCPGSQRIAGISSPPLDEIVEAILEPSQNWMTEQLVHVLGVERGSEGSWREGFRVEQEFLTREAGVDSMDLHYRDGSGLSAYNLVTPRAIVRILEFMRESPNADLYRLALAEPGEEDSTLRNRLPGLEGRLYGKTGTISHVNSLSGYLTTDSGRHLIFSILTNGSGLPSGTVRAGIDRIVQITARR
jgi:D-alanyl-D-alanine carboxypeptidase/D-alanyl-D-alanine-endopeptidase (penicillin-binding protein 4)